MKGGKKENRARERPANRTEKEGKGRSSRSGEKRHLLVQLSGPPEHFMCQNPMVN